MLRLCLGLHLFALAAALANPPRPNRQLPEYDEGPRRRPLVAGIGFGHTATTSLAAALRGLNLRTKHWAPETRTLILLRLNGGMPPPEAKDILKNYSESGVNLLEQSVSIADASRNFEWGWQLLNETDAILDEPVNTAWRYIYERFPDTKFVLTLRNSTEWAESQYKWYSHDADGRMNSVLPKDWMYWGPWCNKPLNVSCSGKNFEYGFGTSRPSKEDLIEAYDRHVAEVRSTIPKNQLLEMTISKGDGYEKLVPFLDVPWPVDRSGRKKAFPSYCNGECVHTEKPANAQSEDLSLLSQKFLDSRQLGLGQ